MWSGERVELLRKYWAEGLSARHIAKVMGGFGHCADGGRSAILGKVHRLGLNKRLTLVKQPSPKFWTPARRAAHERNKQPRVMTSRPKPEKPRKLDIPVTDPSVLAAAALIAASDAAQKRRNIYRAAGRGVGGWA